MKGGTTSAAQTVSLTPNVVATPVRGGNGGGFLAALQKHLNQKSALSFTAGGEETGRSVINSAGGESKLEGLMH